MHTNTINISVTKEMFNKGVSQYESKELAEQTLATVLKTVKGYAGMKRSNSTVYVVDVIINITDPCLVIGAKDALDSVIKVTSAWAGLDYPVKQN